MDPVTGYPGTDMKQKLILPNDQSISVAMNTQREKPHHGFAPNTSGVYAATVYPHRESSNSCSALRTFAVCVISIAVVAGFAVLYVQMTNLEHQVQQLKAELAYEEYLFNHPGPDLDSEATGSAPSGSEEDTIHMPGEANEKDHPHARARRSVHSSRGHVGTSNRHTRLSHYSSHVTPQIDNNGGSTRIYAMSEWFMWTSQPTLSHAQIPLDSTGKYFVVPHNGYYYIYSQMVILSENQRDLYTRGHALYVKRNCGQSVETMLTFSSTTPMGTRPPNSTVLRPPVYDTSYIGGVYYLQRYDMIGIKPYGASLSSRYSLQKDNSYFGLFLLSPSQQSQGGNSCYPRI